MKCTRVRFLAGGGKNSLSTVRQGRIALPYCAMWWYLELLRNHYTNDNCLLIYLFILSPKLQIVFVSVAFLNGKMIKAYIFINLTI